MCYLYNQEYLAVLECVKILNPTLYKQAVSSLEMHNYINARDKFLKNYYFDLF